jgi:hypothetical protein
MGERAPQHLFWIALSAIAGCQSAPENEWRVVATGEPVKAIPKINALAIGDYNADGRLDIACVNGDPGELLVLLQQDQGRFAPLQGSGSVPIGATASGLAAADLNGDKRFDLVVCFHDRDEVAVLLGKADGSFEPPLMQPLMTRTQGNPHIHNLALADLNGDGHQDIIVAQADDNAIGWALGDGTGKFRPSGRMFPAGRHPYTITVADLNGDDRPDLAAPNAESHDLTIGLNDGEDGFTAPVRAKTPVPPQTLALAAGDINGDGHADLIANSDQNQRELTLLIGDGQGGFARSPHVLAAPARCYGQIVADFNGDSMLDVAAPCIDRSSVLVWLAQNPAALQFERVEFSTPSTDSQVLAVADLNGGGALDVVSAGWAKPTITVLRGERETD